MNRVISIISIVCLTTQFSANAQKVQDLGWLQGVWVSTQDDVTFTEEWTLINDSTFSGHSTLESNGVVHFSEKLSIETQNRIMVYVAVLPDKTAIFPLEQFKKQSISFLDPSNDFPSRITYARTDVGLDIILEGSPASGAPIETLHFTKKP